MKNISLFVLALLASSAAMAQYVDYPKDAQILSLPGRVAPHYVEKTTEYDMTGYLLPSEGLPVPVVVHFIDQPAPAPQPVAMQTTPQPTMVPVKHHHHHVRHHHHHHRAPSCA